MSYRIFETRRFQKDLEALSGLRQERILTKLQEFAYPQIREHPHLGTHIKKLKGFNPETWRYRIGAWRFFYEIDEKQKIVFMLTASHRSRSY